MDTWPKRYGDGWHAERRIASGDQGLNIEHHFKKGQYSAAYSGFEGIEDNTDRIQTREGGRGRAIRRQDAGQRAEGRRRGSRGCGGIAESHCVKGHRALDAKKLGFRGHRTEDRPCRSSEEL